MTQIHNTPPSLRHREYFLDALRGFAIILVVFGHIISCYRDSFPDVHYWSDLVFSFHMPLFFFVSGYCHYLSSGTSSTNLRFFLTRSKKSASKLLTCYFLWSGIYYLLRFGDDLLFSNAWVAAIFTFRGCAPLWFLAALFAAQAMLYFFQFITKNRLPLLAVPVALSAVLTFVCSSWMRVHFPPELCPANSAPLEDLVRYELYVSLYRCFPCFFFVGIGYLMAPLLRRCAKRKAPIGLLLGSASTALCLALQYVTHNHVNLHLFKLGEPLIFFLSGLAGSIGLFLLFQALGRWLPLPVLRLLGMNSLGIMVLHYTPLKTMEWAFRLSSLVASTSPLLLMLATLFLSVLFSLVGSLLIKKRLYL